MRDLVTDFKAARLYEPPYDLKFFTNEDALRVLPKKTDAFVVEAALHAAPIFGPDARRFVDIRQKRGLMREEFVTLNPLRAALLNDEELHQDIAYWLWGPTMRAGKFLFSIVAEMGRGYVVRRLRQAGWETPHLRKLFGEWLVAARVHKSSREAALDAFLRPRAPRCIGKTTYVLIPHRLRELARELVPDDAASANDLAVLLTWIVARAQRTNRVSIPTRAITQGRKAHPDSAGLTTQAGRKLWPLVRDRLLTRTRGHSAGNSVAEYEIRPEYVLRMLGKDGAIYAPSGDVTATNAQTSTN